MCLTHDPLLVLDETVDASHEGVEMLVEEGRDGLGLATVEAVGLDETGAVDDLVLGPAAGTDLGQVLVVLLERIGGEGRSSQVSTGTGGVSGRRRRSGALDGIGNAEVVAGHRDVFSTLLLPALALLNLSQGTPGPLL